MRTRTLLSYSLIALLVIILGAFTGWYFFLKTKTQNSASEDAARGYTTGGIQGSQNAPLQPEQTGFFSRVLSSITGGGTGVSEPLTTSLISDVSGSVHIPTPESSFSNPAVTTKLPAQLLHVHQKPVAGLSFVKREGKDLLRYVERSSGYIFEVDPETGLVTRLTNTLTPKIYEASFISEGRIVERSLDEAGNIVTMIASISTSSKSANATSSSVSRIALPQNIRSISIDPKTGSLFYLIGGGAGAQGIRTESNGSKPKQIFSSPVFGWQSEWLSDGRILLTQAASDDMPGYSYELKADGSLNMVVRAIAGLTVLGRGGGALLYGESSGGILGLFVQVRSDATPIRLPVRTVAEKCVWLEGKEMIAYCAVPRGITPRRFLDDWYRGVAHSSDALWRINASAGSAEVIYTPNTSIDMENLTIDADGTHVAFMSGVDKSLWLLRLTK